MQFRKLSNRNVHFFKQSSRPFTADQIKSFAEKLLYVFKWDQPISGGYLKLNSKQLKVTKIHLRLWTIKLSFSYKYLYF